MFKELTSIVKTLIIALALSGCVSPRPAEFPTRMVERLDFIELKEAATYRMVDAAQNIVKEVGCPPGIYKAHDESDMGVYYIRKEEKPLIFEMWPEQKGKPTRIYLGGIWIPTGGAPRIYTVTAGFEAKEIGADHINAPQNLSAMIQSYTDSAALTGRPVASAAVGGAIGVAITRIAQANSNKLVIYKPSNDPDFDGNIMKGLHLANGSSAVLGK